MRSLYNNSCGYTGLETFKLDLSAVFMSDCLKEVHINTNGAIHQVAEQPYVIFIFMVKIHFFTK